MAPTKAEDPTWSIDDARYSAIVYKPSDVPNASGPHVHDPRSGEILESHINWYHNVMSLLKNWYFVQAAPNDERAQTMEFSDELMGELIRFVSSHEVGHTLGLRHNFGSSSTYPVEKLRDKKWLKENGHAASIMDYARFNYVAQPGDGIKGSDLYPKINFYDKWAIEWGYKLIPNAKTPEQEKTTLNKWILAKANDPKYWFGTETNPDDPRSQSEDLGDDAMIASEYGIKNLKYTMPNLVKWTSTANKDYSDLKAMYLEITTQFNRYLGHVTKNVGGIYETPKTNEQAGAVYQNTPKIKQARAIAFLNNQLFTTPEWIINNKIYNLTGIDGVSIIQSMQSRVLNSLISSRTIYKLAKAEEELGKNAYTPLNMFNDLNNNIFKELNAAKPIDIYRRNLQRAYIRDLGELVNPPKAIPSMTGVSSTALSSSSGSSDATAIARAQLMNINSRIKTAIAKSNDQMTKIHLIDLQNSIKEILENNK